MTAPAAGGTVRLPETRNIERLIAQARRDRCIIVLERMTARRDGTTRTTPVLEITPHGDVWEIPPPRMTVPLLDRLIHTDLDYHAGCMNRRAAAGHARIAKLVIDSRDYMNAEAEHRRFRPRRSRRSSGAAA